MTSWNESKRPHHSTIPRGHTNTCYQRSSRTQVSKFILHMFLNRFICIHIKLHDISNNFIIQINVTFMIALSLHPPVPLGLFLHTQNFCPVTLCTIRVHPVPSLMHKNKLHVIIDMQHSSIINMNEYHELAIINNMQHYWHH